MPTRRRLIAGAGATAGLLLAPVARGADGVTQVAGVYRRGVGGIVVDALLDGFVPLDVAMLNGATEDEKAALLREAFLARPEVATSINAYLVRSDGRIALVDGGAGDAFGPTAGRLGRALEAAGVAPGEVDTVFATHLHPDHVGLFAADGAATFPEATLVVHEAERAFWTDEANFSGADERTRSFAAAARAAIAPYRERTRLAADGQTVLPGVSAMHLPGHTPGHTGLMIEDGGERLLLWADIVHIGPVQFAMPGVTIPFDVDPDAAARTRRDVMETVARERLAFGGSHVDFPGFGHLAPRGEGYAFAAARWDHRL